MEATAVLDSPFGLIEAAATSRGITRIRVLRSRVPTRPRSRLPAEASVKAEARVRPCARARLHLRELRRELRAYFAGKRTRFDVALDLSAGTPFQRRVWRACMRIPRGEVRSYGELTRTAGVPRAARAVGRAMGANPLPIVVPCHRVIRSDGSLGGYGLGLPLKRKLLRLEGVL